MLFQIGSSYNAAISEIILAKTVSQNYACPSANFEKKLSKITNTGGPPLTRKSLTRFPLPRFFAHVRVSGGISVSRGTTAQSH